MKYFDELNNVETNVVKLEDLKNVVSVLLNGTGCSSKEELISAIAHVYDNINVISTGLSKDFKMLWDTIAKK